MYFIYSFFWYLLLPFVYLRLLWKSRKEPAYRKHIKERFACYDKIDATNTPLIWIHAVSVGETKAAQPLIAALLAKYPNDRLLLTHITPNGRLIGQQICEKYPGEIEQCYLPYDLGFMLQRFFKRYQPRLGILIETEVWPNLIRFAKQQKIPMFLVNARLSERSLRKAKRYDRLIRHTLQNLTGVIAQTQNDAHRFKALGVNPLAISGNLKFDVLMDTQLLERGRQLRTQWARQHVLLCASTRDGEEALIIQELAKRIQTQQWDTQQRLLVITPRHPERSTEIIQIINAAKLKYQLRSNPIASDETLNKNIDIILGDSMGEMTAYYAAADVAFIGGSLLPFGAQNLIEASAAKVPVLIGPHYFNFSSVTSDALQMGAAQAIANAKELFVAAGELFSDKKKHQHMVEQATTFSKHYQGATQITMDVLSAQHNISKTS